MNWNLEGMHVEGYYLDGEIPVSGIVTLSRVQYGGDICHSIRLDNGFSCYKGAISREAGGTVIVDHKYITKVKDAN